MPAEVLAEHNTIPGSGAHHEAEFECKGKENREGVLVFIHILVQLWQHLHRNGLVEHLSVCAPTWGHYQEEAAHQSRHDIHSVQKHRRCHNEVLAFRSLSRDGALSSFRPVVNSCLLKYPIRDAPIFHASKSTWKVPMQPSKRVRGFQSKSRRLITSDLLH